MLCTVYYQLQVHGSVYIATIAADKNGRTIDFCEVCDRVRFSALFTNCGTLQLKKLLELYCFILVSMNVAAKRTKRCPGKWYTITADEMFYALL